MAADLTACIRAKLDEVKHREDCASRFGATSPAGEFYRRCTCDRPQRVADLVRRMIEAGSREALAWRASLGVSGSGDNPPLGWLAPRPLEAALAVPSKEGTQ